MEHNKTILVTGAAGFIGFHLARKLCEEGFRVIGIDNLNDYYDVTLKKDRLKLLEGEERFEFVKTEINDYKALESIFQESSIDYCSRKVIMHRKWQLGMHRFRQQ